MYFEPFCLLDMNYEIAFQGQNRLYFAKLSPACSFHCDVYSKDGCRLCQPASDIDLNFSTKGILMWYSASNCDLIT